MFAFQTIPQPDPELLYLMAGLAGLLLQVSFAYVKGLRTKYAGLASEQKALLQVGLSALAAVILYLVSCVPIDGSPLFPVFQCTNSSIKDLLYALVWSIGANQGVYIAVTKNFVMEDVREAKELRDSGIDPSRLP